MHVGDTPLVASDPKKCRICYTCIRVCPAKAIRIVDGHAKIEAQRCIGCGSCILSCTRKANHYYNSIPDVENLLGSGARVVAMVAPTYCLEFGFEFTTAIPTAVRKLGFSSVHNTSFGGDLVAREYARLFGETKSKVISSICPTVVSLIKRYSPDLVPNLATIASPMVAMARVLRKELGPDIKVIFIGPCVSAKSEATNHESGHVVDGVLTFSELRKMFETRDINLAQVDPGEFDPPAGRLGALLQIGRGILPASGLKEDLLTGHIIIGPGKDHFIDVIRDFRRSPEEKKLSHLLACDGCVRGPGFTKPKPPLEGQRIFGRKIAEKLPHVDEAQWKADLERFSDVSLYRGFAPYNQRMPRPSEEEISKILAQMGKHTPEDEMNCGVCGYSSCRRHATAVSRGFAEVTMCLPHAIEQLKTTIQELEGSHRDLQMLRKALHHSEKLATIGQLAAGIAHEINNPLGVVLLYAKLLSEACEHQPELRNDVALIAENADRCKKIVSGLLNFARQTKVFRQLTDVREMVKHAIELVPKPENIAVTMEGAPDPVMAEVDFDQMIQVLTNIISNAYAAMPKGGELKAVITASDAEVSFGFSDTGSGIPKDHLNRIFEPFFTTKSAGAGTGLGLSIAHGIVKMHNGRITVKSNVDPKSGPTGTTFTVTVPRQQD